MNNPPISITLPTAVLDSLETYVRTQAAYMALTPDAIVSPEGRVLAGKGAQAALAVTQALVNALPAAGLGTLGAALANESN